MTFGNKQYKEKKQIKAVDVDKFSKNLVVEKFAQYLKTGKKWSVDKVPRRKQILLYKIKI